MESYDRDLHTHGIKSYEQPKQKNKKGLPIGLVLGVIVGSIIGLFLAPKSGQSLREDLKDPKGTFEDQKDKVVHKVREKKAEIDEVKRIKDTDESDLEAQKRAIHQDVKDHNDGKDSIDLSKL